MEGNCYIVPMFWLSNRKASAMIWHSFGSGPPPAAGKQFVVPKVSQTASQRCTMV